MNYEMPSLENLDRGTRPHRPPFQVIFDWAKQVFSGKNEKGIKSISWAIVNSIAKVGTPSAASFVHSSNGRRKEFINL